MSAEQNGQQRAAQVWRLRVPSEARPTSGTAVTVRLDATETEARVWIAVGNRYRRLPLSLDEAWAVLKLLAAAMDLTGEPPEFVQVPITPSRKLEGGQR